MTDIKKRFNRIAIGVIAFQTFISIAVPAAFGQNVTKTPPDLILNECIVGNGLNVVRSVPCGNLGLVSSVFGRTGAVVSVNGDYTVTQVTGAAPIASPTFTGDPKAPTPAPGDNDTSLATTLYVMRAINLEPVRVAITGDKCDGVTDIKSLIDAAQAIASGTLRPVRLPGGDCITSPLSYSSTNACVFEGQGEGLTRLKLISSAASSVVMTLVDADYCAMRDMTVDGNSIVSTDENFICINCTSPILERVTFENGLPTVVVAWGGTTTDWQIRNSKIMRGGAATSTVNNQAVNVAPTVFGGKIRNSEFNSSIVSAGDLDIQGSKISNYGYGAAIATGLDVKINITNNDIFNGLGIDLDQTAVLGIENLADDAIINNNRINNISGTGIGNFASNVNREGNTISDCGNLPAGRTGTSTTSVLIASSGSKVFTTQTGLTFAATQVLKTYSAANPANFMHVTVNSYVSGTGVLTTTATASGGAGTLNDWVIQPIGWNPNAFVDVYSSGSLFASYGSIVNNMATDSGFGRCKYGYAQVNGGSLTDIQVFWNTFRTSTAAYNNFDYPVNDVSNAIRDKRYFTNKKAIQFSRLASAASGAVSYTGIGFRPAALDISCNVNFGQVWWSRGLATSASANNWAMFVYHIASISQTNKIIVIHDDATTANFQDAVVTSYDSDGFTLTWTKHGTPASGFGMDCFVLASQ